MSWAWRPQAGPQKARRSSEGRAERWSRVIVHQSRPVHKGGKKLDDFLIVSTKATEKAQVESLTFVPLRKFCEKF
jgi:hypothetical protein